MSSIQNIKKRGDMIRILKNSFSLIMVIGLFVSCNEISKKAEEQINKLNKKTEELDSLVNREIDKVMTLDTLINLENSKVKKLDSLVNKTSTKLDSLAKEKIKSLENIMN